MTNPSRVPAACILHCNQRIRAARTLRSLLIRSSDTWTRWSRSLTVTFAGLSWWLPVGLLAVDLQLRLPTSLARLPLHCCFSLCLFLYRLVFFPLRSFRASTALLHMATPAHCAYCFECLAATFEHRQPLSLSQVEELWAEYNADPDDEDASIPADDEDMTDVDLPNPPSAKPAAISRLLNPSSAAKASPADSSTSLASLRSSGSKSSTPASSSKSSSLSSFFSRSPAEESHPLFITWNTLSKSGHKSLRGCIGTFEPLPLSTGLQSYSLTSAFEDHRFNPIPASLLPSLQVCVTLLTNFSDPDKDAMNWTVGEHGIRLSFQDRGRRYGATYLPDVAREQGWGKEETIVSLMRKAGWAGKRDDWRNVKGLEIVRYEGKKVSLDYLEWREWSDWVGTRKGLDKKGST
ncbi:hypothetical protein K461DRAFT_276552 [Myriangium duriaei CBS 260.36]|uniref:AMMECR1 domain-containing protein n=1 Tax=Myriangium duriaei CBS 260.36 TaxID=1168546 RepID=A0A9P4MJH9_9PEZI|nr:hypothetical protein K461DRAFT_276552 [Myriangium duriaei CBS 260.36]